MPELDGLSQGLGYTFQHNDLLKTALTHRSAGKKNNERLEFLGDSVLSLVISQYLIQHLPNASEGDLSRIRSSLVKGDKLAEIARRLSLGDNIKLGSGELKSGGYRRASILADCMEAIIGAVFLDSDFVTCQQVVVKLYENDLASLPDAAAIKDNKTRLQEYLQARRLALPEYEVMNVTGEPHQQVFTVQCNVGAMEIMAQASANSRRKAEQKAAALVLEQIDA